MSNRLFEIFEKVNKIKINEEAINMVNPQEKQIVNDILSLTEDLNSVTSKLIDYGKKGLLTMAIILAVAKGVDAASMPKVINTGIEYVKDDAGKTDFYSACVGLLVKLSDDEKTNLERKKDLIDCRIYFENLRDHIPPRELGTQKRIMAQYVMEEVMKNFNKLQDYIHLGKHVHTDSTQATK